MPDGDGLVGGQVDLRLHREEAVDLALRGKLGCEVLQVHVMDLAVVVHLLVGLHALLNSSIIESF